MARNKVQFLIAVFAVAWAIAIYDMPEALSQTMVWTNMNSEGGEWLDESNWIDYLASDFWEFEIDNGGSAIISSGLVRGSFGYIGKTYGGNLIQTGGQFDLTNTDRPLWIGYDTGSVGRYDLLDGSVNLDVLEIGLAGQGTFNVAGGDINIDTSITIGGFRGIGELLQTGGVVRRTARSRATVYVGTSTQTSEQASYELSGGRLEVTDVSVQNGTFRQTGGSVWMEEALYARTGNDEQPRIEFGPGVYPVSTVRINAEGWTARESARIVQQGGFVQASALVRNGTNEISSGLRVADSISILDAGSWQMNGGVTLANNLELRGSASPVAFDTTALVDHQAGLLRTGRLRLAGDYQATYNQSGGTVSVSRLEIGSSGSGNSTYILAGGQLHVERLLRIAGPSEVAEFDFHNQSTVLDVGPNAYIEIGQGAVIKNAQNATLRIGEGSLVVLPEGMDLASIFGNVEPSNYFVYHPNQMLSVPAGQSAFIGGLTLRDGVVVNGRAYDDSPNNFPVISRGSLRVEQGGLLEGGSDSYFGIVNSVNSGVFGGAMSAEILQLGESGASGFTIADGGLVDLNRLVVMPSTQNAAFRVSEASSLLTNSLMIQGARADFSLTGGFTQVRGELQANAFAKVNVSGGELTADRLTLLGQSHLRQTGGVVRAGITNVENGLVTISGGEMILESQARLLSETDGIDFVNSDASLSVEGAIVVSFSNSPFKNAGNASVHLDEHTLFVVPPGTNLSNGVGNYDSQAIIATIHTDFELPADRELRGAGDLSVLGRKSIYGRITADPGRGIDSNRITIHDGAFVDLGTGGVYSLRSSIGASALEGGTLHAGWLSVDPFPDAEFRQSGGESHFNRVDVRGEGKLRLLGGQMTVDGPLTGASIDFGGGDATLTLGPRGTLHLDETNVLGADNASLVLERGALLVHDAATPPSLLFGTFTNHGITHENGTLLTISSNEFLGSEVRLSGSIVNAGTISPGAGSARLEVLGGDFTQQSTGTLTLQIATPTSLDIVNVPAGNAHLAGTLELDFLSSFVPTVGDRLQLIYARSVSGKFDDIIAPSLPDGLGVRFYTQNGAGFVEFVSQPQSFTGDWLVADFNGDGSIDAQDIDMLALTLREPWRNQQFENDPLFDLNNSGYVNRDDIQALVEQYLDTRLGDVNLDGTIDAVDLQAIQANMFQSETGWMSGDMNSDGITDGKDFNIWLSNRNWSRSSRAVVPEPHGLLSACCGLFFLISRRSRLYRDRK